MVSFVDTFFNFLFFFFENNAPKFTNDDTFLDVYFSMVTVLSVVYIHFYYYLSITILANLLMEFDEALVNICRFQKSSYQASLNIKMIA